MNVSRFFTILLILAFIKKDSDFTFIWISLKCWIVIVSSLSDCSFIGQYVHIRVDIIHDYDLYSLLLELFQKWPEASLILFLLIMFDYFIWRVCLFQTLYSEKTEINISSSFKNPPWYWWPLSFVECCWVRRNSVTWRKTRQIQSFVERWFPKCIVLFNKQQYIHCKRRIPV